MKVLLICATLVVCAIAQNGGKPMWRQNLQQCLQQYQLDEATVKSNSVPESKKCFYRCMKEKAGIMNAAGQLTIAEFKAKATNAPPEKIANLEACAATSTRSDPCDTAKALSDCMRQKRNAGK